MEICSNSSMKQYFVPQSAAATKRTSKLDGGDHLSLKRSAFVLVSCDMHMTNPVSEKLEKIPLVTSVKRVTGMYDVLVTLKSDSLHKIIQVIGNKIRLVDGVRSALTLLVNGSEDSQ